MNKDTQLLLQNSINKGHFMKAAVLKAPRNLELENVPTLNCPDGGILVKTQACAICSTDVKMFYKGQKDLVYPRILGHEITGIIVENQACNSNLDIGTRVQIFPGQTCGECTYCKRGVDNHCENIRIRGFNYDGGFAEFVAIQPKSIRLGAVNIVPNNISFEEAALTEPLACCINGQELTKLNKDDCVLIFGAGPIGCLHALLARVKGAGKVIIVERKQNRIEMARRTKPDRIIDASKESLTAVTKIIEDETEKRGADVIQLACSEQPLTDQLMKLLAPRGRICLFSGMTPENSIINLNSNIIHYRDISIVGAYGCTIAQNSTAIELISSRKINLDWLITKRIALDQIHDGIEYVSRREGMKAVVTKF